MTVISCKTDDNKYKVEYKGALKNMMHAGDVSAKADLKNYSNIKHFYALGAFEYLKGEIQIFNGEPSNTIVVENKLTFDKSFEKKASLLVYASVNKWESIKIPEKVVTYEQLEIYIAQVAKEQHININEPFPFLIEGTLESFDWHVINWKNGDTEHSHEKHINSGLHGTINNREVKMLGFYSDAHHAIFTHHTTNMHIHVKTIDNIIAGHVDGLKLGKGMILKVPNAK
jgi:acetolactate decarboxylase